MCVLVLTILIRSNKTYSVPLNKYPHVHTISSYLETPTRMQKPLNHITTYSIFGRERSLTHDLAISNRMHIVCLHLNNGGIYVKSL